MYMADMLATFMDTTNHVTIHDLNMIDVKEEFHIRRTHLLHDV